MDWKSVDIKTNFIGVVRDVKLLTTQQLELKYAKFKTECEPMYKMAINCVVNGTIQDAIKKLELMLKARDDMDAGKISKLNTDMLVGNMLGKEYIYPKTETPSREDLIRAVNTIRSKDAEAINECD